MKKIEIQFTNRIEIKLNNENKEEIYATSIILQEDDNFEYIRNMAILTMYSDEDEDLLEELQINTPDEWYNHFITNHNYELVVVL